MKVSKDGILFPDTCPICHSEETVVSTYADGERFIECEGCYTVIGDIPKGKKYAISKTGEIWKRGR